MAGRRKQTCLRMMCIFWLLTLAFTPSVLANFQCISSGGKPVDWYIVYKLPKDTNHHNSEVTKGTEFFYMDVNNPKWTLSTVGMNQSGQAVYNTLQQIYGATDSDDYMYAMYNDEPGTGGSVGTKTSCSERLRNVTTKRSSSSTSHGHTKGVIGFDTWTGFWLVQSTPRFPPPRAAKYRWPDSALDYAQSFLCISMPASQINEIGIQLQYNHPDVYDCAYPASMASKYPDMTKVLREDYHVQKEPWNRQTKLTSLKGTTFHSFAKYKNFEQDLYHDWLAPTFKSNMLVETWQNGRGKMPSNCTGSYKVYNIGEVEIQASQRVDFHETKDHAKWAVTTETSNKWTCIGDINRQCSQKSRPGGTVCFQNSDVWQNFKNLVKQTQKCTSEPSPCY